METKTAPTAKTNQSKPVKPTVKQQVKVTKPEEFDVKKNAIGVKQHDKKQVEKPVKVKYPTFTSALDSILKEGGSWEHLIKMGNEAKTDLEKLHPEIPIKFNGKAKLISLVKYRMEIQGKKDYLGKKKLTDKGVF